MKKAKTTALALDLQEQYKGQPHGWIQWKGTSVSLSIDCKFCIVSSKPRYDLNVFWMVGIHFAGLPASLSLQIPIDQLLPRRIYDHNRPLCLYHRPLAPPPVVCPDLFEAVTLSRCSIACQLPFATSCLILSRSAVRSLEYGLYGFSAG